MPAKKGENLTYLREDSVSATELSKLGKCECLIKVEKLQNISNGKKAHSTFENDCLRFLGASSNAYSKERLLLENSLMFKLATFLGIVVLVGFAIALFFVFR